MLLSSSSLPVVVMAEMPMVDGRMEMVVAVVASKRGVLAMMMLRTGTNTQFSQPAGRSARPACSLPRLLGEQHLKLADGRQSTVVHSASPTPFAAPPEEVTSSASRALIGRWSLH